MLKKKTSPWKLISYGLGLFVLLFVFSLYFAPDMMVAITNTVWAMCGW